MPDPIFVERLSLQTTSSRIPLWFRLLPACFFAASVGAWMVLLGNPPREYSGLAYESVVALLLTAMLVTGGAAVVLFFFPNRLLARAAYYGMVKGRWLVLWLALYGLLEYYLRLPLFYVEKPNLIFNHAALFGLRGIVPLLLAVLLFAVLVAAQPIQNPFPMQWQAWVQEKREIFLKQISVVDGAWWALLPAILPVGLVLFVIYGLWGAKLSDYLPIFWNDAIGYWLWIRQFSHYGLGGGYNFPNELMPAARFNHFGEGSPLYIYFYGLFGYLFGWAPHLPILVNFGLILASVYGFSRLMRLDTPQNLVMALILAVSWPVMIFAATTSHESLNQAIGIIFAGLFLRLRQAERVSPLSAFVIVLFAFLAGMLRLSWVILFPPLFYFLFPVTPPRRIAFSLLGSGALAIAILWLTGLLVPPINNSIFTALGSERGWLFGLQMQFLAQFKKLVIHQTMIPGMAALFLLSMLLTQGIWELLPLLRQKTKFDELLKSQAVFDIYSMLALLLTSMALYLVNGFYRVFFAPLLTSLFMRIAQKKYRFAWSMAFFSLLFAPVILTGQGDWDGAKLNYTYRPPEVTASQETIDRLISYDADAKNAWCNTILLPLDFYDARLTLLPPGIGVSYIHSYPMPNIPLRSKYLWVSEKDYAELAQENALHADLLAELPIGRLYRNLDANCTP